ncbi:serine/threonine protein kinase [Frankia sp. CNm7]|uniref:non-specific serine/threonine protein kinase n=1 Tax=Frankia nepalensis TaxID=1836974 RepID=A0A937RJ58_9ACTN|nr:serine/threonine-protein kinase [Frankia nepalensis]MBL7495224.1 serine/threonine protein kinase [Frankia nepalensis]MBL7513219.1 serine/threonine protein kinase [Frankia nepalensis]MBL7524106.1 serine/threonine protein kinase [Frankia nepalensis]MBL7631197.1 serine/threonine protein kinase [Frankia nepalensis]
MSAEASGSESRVVAGRYRLLERLGSGTYGTVWRAHDDVLAVQVALKELRHDVTTEDGQSARAQLEREARIVARLRDHPHVVTVHDIVTDGGLPWIVMELVESRSLADLVRATGKLPPERVAAIGTALLDALVSAHALGITHRDVKPANVLIGAGDRVLLADFGVASHDAQPTIGHGPVGTLAYMAPEQFAGVRAKPAGDLFSLGATLYFALTGGSPFGRSTEAATIHAVLHDAPPRPAGPDRLARVVLGLLAKDPADRTTAGEAAAAFAAVAAGQAPRPELADLLGSTPPGQPDMPGLPASPGAVDSAATHGAKPRELATGARTGPTTTMPGTGRTGRGPARVAFLDRVVGAVLLIVATALALAPWLAVSLIDPPWWGYSAATVLTVFFGAWAAAFGTVLVRPPDPGP